jgi:hypothetical protein
MNNKPTSLLTIITLALFCASTALADHYIYTPEGVYAVFPQGTFTGGYQYSLPRVIITDPCGNQHHGTRYSYDWSFSD